LIGAYPVTLDDGFAIVATLTTDSSSATTRLYRSTDAMTWSDVELPAANVNSFAQLADGSLAGVGWSNAGSPVAIVSTDGVDWTATDLSGLVTEADGASANLQVLSTAIGASGITLGGQITGDPWTQSGPTTMSKDGVTISMINQIGELSFTDESTGEVIGHFGDIPSDADPSSEHTKVDPDTGDVQLLADDGSVRLTVSNAERNALINQGMDRYVMKALILHSGDGVNWSREDVSDIAGFPVKWIHRVQAAGDKVLVTVLDTSTLNDLGKPTTVVLVGTRKS
jgi:hypothetical protein